MLVPLNSSGHGHGHEKSLRKSANNLVLDQKGLRKF